MLWIDKVGIEIECSIDNEFYNALGDDMEDLDGFQLDEDGSIDADKGECVEFQSVPTSSLPLLFKNVKKIYKHIIEINKTMGLHIHLSFKKDNYYYRVCSKKFNDFFLKRLRSSKLYKTNEELRNRVINNNQYAMKLRNYREIDSQLRRSSDERYRIVNFCKTEHGTVEFRIFPAMHTAKEIMEAIDFTIKTVIEWIKSKKYLHKVKSEYTLRKLKPRVHIINEITDKLFDKNIEVK